MFKSQNILLINPPVYDFAAYDLWAKPLGLLYLSSILKQQNINVTLFDYMDRQHDIYLNNTSMSSEYIFPKNGSNIYGCGHYIKKEIIKPDVIKNIKRKYFRFGIPEQEAEKFFLNLKNNKKIDMIIIGSIMTYWYLGVAETAKILKKIFPDVPIILGGVYATLCEEHAKNLYGIDEVVAGSLINFNAVFKKYNFDINISCDFKNFPAPDYSYYRNLEYIVLKTSIGCPFKCSYCAQYVLNKNGYSVKNPMIIKEEIERQCTLNDNVQCITNGERQKMKDNGNIDSVSVCGADARNDRRNGNINNIAFYDDALLFNADNNIKVLLKEFAKDGKKFYFHTPNGLHARFVDDELAELMFNAKFIQPRFSLETSNAEEQKNSNNKVSNKEYERTINFLRKAGYKDGEYITYLLMGMPGQSMENVRESIKYVHSLGSRISLSEYSPIPYTADWQKLDENLKKDPLTQNNTFFISLNKDYEKLQELKILAKELNNKL